MMRAGQKVLTALKTLAQVRFFKNSCETAAQIKLFRLRPLPQRVFADVAEIMGLVFPSVPFIPFFSFRCAGKPLLRLLATMKKTMANLLWVLVAVAGAWA